MKEPNCPVSEEQLNGLVDRELSDVDTRTVAMHVVACGWCARIVGQLTASEALLRTPLPYERKDAAPSTDFWARLSDRLDDVDNVVRATSPGAPAPVAAGTRMGLLLARRSTPSYVPQLAAAGVLILLCTIAARHVGLAWSQGVGPARLVHVHQNAVAAASAPAAMASTGSLRPVTVGGNALVLSPVSQRSNMVRMVDLEGAPAVCSVVGSAGRPVTLISTGRGAISLRGMQQLAGFDGRYHFSVQPDGSVVMVDVHGEKMWRAAVGRVGPDDLLTLMSQVPAYTGYEGSM